MPIEPDPQQLNEIVARAGSAGDGPVVMLNLNRYREHAVYEQAPPAGADAEISGRDAYARYAEVAAATLDGLGGKILWYAPVDQTVVGDATDRYDEVIAVWYPSRAAFVALATDPEILTALADRVAGLERAALICCDSGPEAVLTGI
jgi:uncharacterized protein (DUF1330 family)